MPTLTASLHYHVELHHLHAHQYRVTLRIATPAAQQLVSLPVWIPGSYLVREFAKNLQELNARQNGQPIAVQQLSKHQWQLDCSANAPVELSYLVNAYDTSVRTAWLDQRRGFFNGTSLLLRVHGQEAQPHQLRISPSAQVPDWKLATGLSAVEVDAQGFGTYTAGNYDELVDCPIEMGNFWSSSFTARGVPHRFVVAGAPASFDGERLLRDTQKICEAEIDFWGVAPHSSYVFMLNVTHDGYGGLEHCNSTALICSRSDLPRQGVDKASDGYVQLLGLISHEYFHTWNVKRLRPAELVPYNYDQENYTELLWFFEGFTSYYDDLLLRRAGLIDNATYLKLITKTLNQVQQTPGRKVQSVAQSSFDAWVKYYRQDENTANATVSYYTKGALVAMSLDLKLRQEGQTTLDAVMRALWQRCQGSAMSEADVLTVLQALTGRSWETELQAWVHGTQELPVTELLAAHGVAADADQPVPAQALGLRVQESHSVLIKQVLRGGLAEQAGMMAGDEWYGIEIAGQGWRLGKLEELAMYAPQGTTSITALVARDRQLLRLTLPLPQASAPLSNYKLRVQDEAAVNRWLSA
ncbi:M61 family metallopeptidase [Comamonas kerstersii]|uniref:M61 family metallopeptidase n=1 Tax=Comamonas kerstersii TaxID=225992 RepID=UPI0009871518|nr:M61 family metallopeptidase [Comamonas kerstersii]OOH86799.1 peptidase M61 [Comamonas kerstersii]OOH90189.1 peptidase M61 [Comamonas kerstersii]